MIKNMIKKTYPFLAIGCFYTALLLSMNVPHLTFHCAIFAQFDTCSLLEPGGHESICDMGDECTVCVELPLD